MLERLIAYTILRRFLEPKSKSGSQKRSSPSNLQASKRSHAESQNTGLGFRGPEFTTRHRIPQPPVESPLQSMTGFHIFHSTSSHLTMPNIKEVGSLRFKSHHTNGALETKSTAAALIPAPLNTPLLRALIPEALTPKPLNPKALQPKPLHR